VDDGIGALLNALEATGVADDTLVVLTGDHGESLTEHDIYFDHHGLYEPTIHVPLILRHPGRIGAGATLPPLVQHLDVAPTLLEAVGAPIPAAMEGRSLWPLASGKAQTGGWERVVCCESTWQSKWALRTDDRKLILARSPDRHNMPMRELYDLEADPGETRNLAQERPGEADRLEAELEAWIAAGLAKSGRREDPLRAQGISLGKKWDQWVAAGARD
jgi:arylsulfatase A-like enzyme